MMVAGRFSSLSSLITIVILELVVLLSFLVGDYYWRPIISQVRKTCDVTNSSVVRKLVQKNWNPILIHYGVSLPIECPLNLSRDLLGPREILKRTRSSHWQCLGCGKKFFLERHLDLHLDRRHSNIINYDEDSVCLAYYCDIMRCDVLLSTNFLEEGLKSTDMSVWTPQIAVLQQQQPKNNDNTNSPPTSLFLDKNNDINNQNDKKSKEKGFYKEYKPPAENEQICDEEHFANLKKKCVDLVWLCLRGLISVLDAKDFKSIQSEIESVSCSYLTCARYGDTSSCTPQSRTRGKLRPFFILFGSLLISLCLALAYYFAWVYTQSTEHELPPENIRDENAAYLYDDNDENLIYHHHHQEPNSHLCSSNSISQQQQQQTLVYRTTHL